MAFVNEIISAADAEKYRLDDLWLRWNRFHNKLPPGHQHAWTVDREREAYFIPMAAGGEAFPGRKSCVLHWAGTEWQVDVDQVATKLDNPNGAKSVPYKKIWKLARILQHGGDSVPREEIISILKEALTTYGEMGIGIQIPNTVVTFHF